MDSIKNIDSNWINHNYELLRNYQGYWIAFNQEDGVIAANKSLDIAYEEAIKSGKRYAMDYINPLRYKYGIRILPIRFQAVKYIRGIHTKSLS